MTGVRIPGLRERPPARARVRTISIKRAVIHDLPVRYVEVRFERVDGGAPHEVRRRYYLTAGAMPTTVRGLAAVGVELAHEGGDWVTRLDASEVFELPLVEVACSPEETHQEPDEGEAVRVFVKRNQTKETATQ